MHQKEQPFWREILTISVPLIFSMTSVVLMQFVDALFLSWFSADAIAAVVPAGMASYFLICPFQGTAGFTSTLVAHYVGASRPHSAASAAWQGLYLSLISGSIVFALGFTAGPLFNWVNHSEGIKILEMRYFAITCWGALPTIASAAISGFFTGQGKTRAVMVVQLLGFAVNAVLDYLLIFGKFGFPQWGIDGAAVATVAAQLFIAVVLFLLFFFSGKTKTAVWSDRAFDPELFKRLMRFGIPNGLRLGFEMLAWTVFVLFIGRIGDVELAATNIAFRINGFAFFPIIGLGQAMGILVGQAQGRQDPVRAEKLTYAGFFMAEIWMILLSAIFLLFPETIYGFFRSGNQLSQFETISSTGIILMRFVAVYSLLDACNIIFVTSLQSAGDTRWTMLTSLIANSLFLSVLAVADKLKMGLWVQWSAATAFVMMIALTWWFRFRSGKWKQIRVIESGEMYD